MQAGKSRDEIARVEVLPGFESCAPVSRTITLSGVLTTAYDELNAKTGVTK
jgi:hypothetical protein